MHSVILLGCIVVDGSDHVYLADSNNFAIYDNPAGVGARFGDRLSLALPRNRKYKQFCLAKPVDIDRFAIAEFLLVHHVGCVILATAIQKFTDLSP